MSKNSSPNNPLYKLAQQQFSNLSTAEEAMLESAWTGTEISCTPKDKKQLVARASLLRWLLSDNAASSHVHPTGVQLLGGIIFVDHVDLSRIRLPGTLTLNNSLLLQGLSLNGASIGELSLQGTTINCNQKGVAFKANGITVTGNVFMRRNFRTDGEVQFIRATIHGDLDFENAIINSKNGYSATIDNARIFGNLFMRYNFHATGTISLNGATVEGEIDCHNSHVANKHGLTVSGSRLTAKGSMRLSEATFTGSVLIESSSLDSLELWGSTFNSLSDKPGDTALSIISSTVHKSITFVRPFDNSKPSKIHGTASFRYSSIALFIDCDEVWFPANQSDGMQTNISLNGCKYSSLGTHSSVHDIKFRKKWLDSSKHATDVADAESFLPQPYTHLAEVLKKIGYDSESKHILIEREEQRRLYANISNFERIMLLVFRCTIGYGYRPARMTWWLTGLLIVGTAVFECAYANNYFLASLPHMYISSEITQSIDAEPAIYRQRFGPPYTDADPYTFAEYPRFNAFIYSLDSLLPFVDLHQEKYWLPTSWYRSYLWLHIGLGWVGATLFVAGFTSIVRRD